MRQGIRHVKSVKGHNSVKWNEPIYKTTIKVSAVKMNENSGGEIFFIQMVSVSTYHRRFLGFFSYITYLECQQNRRMWVCQSFLGAFEKLRIATTSFIVSMCPHKKNSPPTWMIFMKHGIWVFFENLIDKIQVSLKCDKNSRYFT